MKDEEIKLLRSIYRGIFSRCNNPNSPSYSRYGAVGIEVDERWAGEGGFRRFSEDMGACPKEGYSIDRIDPKGNYSPSNCRWASRMVQGRNQGKSKETSSKYKGVSYDKVNEKWASSISLGRYGRTLIGRYEEEEDAANAYNLATETIFGEGSTYVVLNDVEEDYSGVNLDSYFFVYWIPKFIRERLRLYEDEGL